MNMTTSFKEQWSQITVQLCSLNMGRCSFNSVVKCRSWDKHCNIHAVHVRCCAVSKWWVWNNLYEVTSSHSCLIKYKLLTIIGWPWFSLVKDMAFRFKSSSIGYIFIWFLIGKQARPAKSWHIYWQSNGNYCRHVEHLHSHRATMIVEQVLNCYGSTKYPNIGTPIHTKKYLWPLCLLISRDK